MKHLRLFNEGLSDSKELDRIINIASDEDLFVKFDTAMDICIKLTIINPFKDMDRYRQIIKEMIARIYHLTGNVEIRMGSENHDTKTFFYVNDKVVLRNNGIATKVTLQELIDVVDTIEFVTNDNTSFLRYDFGVVFFIVYDLLPDLELH